MSDSDEETTGTAPRPPQSGAAARAARDSGSGSASPSSGGAAFRLGGPPTRFAAGTILADRYRIVGLLGRGGMGEVYRADDLKLDQAVALKFLPEAVERDAERLGRFYTEAKLARTITHPAVCRVHDIGDLDGHVFLSMEYVDGEDLATLRKRLGRLSRDKALEIGRQICAGLAAAHAKGVLHRDLKPANVMLDGEGRARITDFGLAGLAETITGDDVRSGTPAYMSPEQLAGREVTVRSDIYSLGLLLYELVTGRRAFDGKTLAEVMRQRAEAAPRPGYLVPDLDARTESVILRCLEVDPQRRPATALAVAALLSGGDALASLIAAGQTPSPEMLASLGAAEERAPMAIAWGALGVTLAGLVVIPWLASPVELTSFVPLEKAPAVLEDRAWELVRTLSPDSAAGDHAVGFSIDQEFLEQVGRDPSPSRWEVLRSGSPSVVHFWYRQSPQPLLSRGSSGKVFWTNPPQSQSGMVSLKLDTRGRLYSFFAAPPQVEPEATTEGSEADYATLFEAAGFDLKAFRKVPSRWTPPMFADHRMAFEGSYPGRPDLAIRIEAASWRGRPVAFYPVSEWTRPEREGPAQVSTALEAGRFVFALLFVGLLASALLLVRRNLLTGRADRAGSARLALGAFLVGAASWTVGAHHVGLRAEEIGVFAQGMGSCLFLASVLWLFYVAIEPFVRRHWPHALISWTRLLANGPGDALVARDLLVGSGLGTVVTIVFLAGFRIPGWIGNPPIEPIANNGYDGLLSLRAGIELVLVVPLSAAALATATFLLLVLLRFVLKRELVAASVLVAVVGTANALRWDLPLGVGIPLSLFMMAAFMTAALRFGLLAYVVAATVVDWWLRTPLSTDWSSFRGEPTLLVGAVVLAMALLAFRRVRRGEAVTVA